MSGNDTGFGRAETKAKFVISLLMSLLEYPAFLHPLDELSYKEN